VSALTQPPFAVLPGGKLEWSAPSRAELTGTLTEQRHSHEYPLAMPTAAMYGVLANKVALMQSPIGWAYPAVLTLYAGQGINLHEPDPTPRPALMTALLGDKGKGKSVVLTRAQKVLGLRNEDVQKATPGSDRGLISIFRAGLKKNEPATLSGGNLVLDEMRSMMEKMAIKGSTLQQLLCNLWSSDYGAAADKQGLHSINVRLSIVGNLKVRDRDEFSTVFAAQSQGGFADRMVLAPGPTNWEFDWNWTEPQIETVTGEDGEEFPVWKRSSRPTPVRATPETYDMLKVWDRAHRAEGRIPGRLGEIALRVAVISASANGDREVSRECMTAALVFADWQMAVRNVYVAGEATNDDAAVTGLIIDAFTELDVSLARGEPKRSSGKPIIEPGGWVNFRLLQRSKSWHKRYSASTVSRNLQALVSTGMLEREFDEISKKLTNRYRTVE
jgi:hypothetical protein